MIQVFFEKKKGRHVGSQKKEREKRIFSFAVISLQLSSYSTY